MKLLLLMFCVLSAHAMQHGDYLALFDDAQKGKLKYEKIIPLLSPEDKEAIISYSSWSSSPEEIAQLRQKKAGTFFDHVVGSIEPEPIGNVVKLVATHCMISPDGNYSICDRKAIHNWNNGSTVFIKDPELVDDSCTIQKNRLIQCTKRRYGKEIDTQDYRCKFLSVWDLVTGNHVVDTIKIADGFEPTLNESGAFCIAFVNGMLSAIPLTHSSSQENTNAITTVYPENPHHFKMRGMWPNGPGGAMSKDDKYLVVRKAQEEDSQAFYKTPELIVFAMKNGPFEFKTLIAGECCGFSDDSSLLATSNGCFIRTYETEKFTQLLLFQFNNYLHSFRFSADKQRLLCEGQQGYYNSFSEWQIEDECTYLCDLGQKELIWHSSYSQPVVISHDMQKVAEQYLGSVWVRNLATLDCFPLTGKKRPLLIDPTDHYLITTSSTDPDTHIELRNAKTGGLIAHLAHDKKNGGLPAFTRDGKSLITYSEGKGVRFKLFPLDHAQLTSEQKMAFFLTDYFARTKTAFFPALLSKMLATTAHGDLNYLTELYERAIAAGAQAGDMQSVHTILEHEKKYPLMRLHHDKNTCFSLLPGDIIRMVKQYSSPAHHKKAIELLKKVIATEKDHDKKDMLYKIMAMLK